MCILNVRVITAYVDNNHFLIDNNHVSCLWKGRNEDSHEDITGKKAYIYYIFSAAVRWI